MTLASRAEALFASSLLRLRRGVRRRVRRPPRDGPRSDALGAGECRAAHAAGSRLVLSVPVQAFARSPAMAQVQVQIKKRPVKSEQPIDLRTPSGKPLPY